MIKKSLNKLNNLGWCETSAFYNKTKYLNSQNCSWCTNKYKILSSWVHFNFIFFTEYKAGKTGSQLYLPIGSAFISLQSK